MRFFCGLLGVIRGRFLSMINSAAHLRWLPSWIWFPLIFWPTFGLTGGSLGVTGGRSFRWLALPLIQHGRYGSHLGFGFRRLSDERLRRLVQFCLAHWGSSIFTIFHFFLNFIFHISTDNFPLWGICHTLRSPRFNLFLSYCGSEWCHCWCKYAMLVNCFVVEIM
jgi:hypothetical protein